MAMRHPAKGLRVINKSNDIIRAEIIVPAGAEVESDNRSVIDQLLGQSSAFAAVGDDAAGRAAPKVDGGDADSSDRAGAGEDGEEPAGEGSAPSSAAPSNVEEAGGKSARTRSGRRG